MKLGPHGDVIGSNLQFAEGTSAKSDLFNNSLIFIGEIQKVYAYDDIASQPEGKADFTLCDIMIYRSSGGTELIRQCRIMQPAWGGGVNNFLEHTYPIPDQNTFNVKKKRSEKITNQIIVSFINGNKQSAIILGAVPHTSQIAKKRRPTKAKGTMLEAEFQGLNWKINNDGSFNLIFNGPRKDDGTIIGTDGPTELTIDPKGNIKLTTNNKQSFQIDRVNQTITAVTGPVSFTMDGKNDKVTVKSKSIETLGSDTNRMYGKKVKISNSPTSEPDENLVLGKTLKEFLSKLCQEVEQLQILGNLGVTCPPPLNASKVTQLRTGYIDNDKILSDFAKTEKGRK